METKKLRRSVQDTVIGGVSGGLGEYFGTDPVIFRILFVVLTLTGGGGVFIYLLMWIFIPKALRDFNPKNDFYKAPEESQESNMNNPQEKTDEKPPMDPTFIKRRKNGNLIGGTILILVGLFFLADDFFPWLSWEYLWPAALIIAGLAIIKINYKPKNQS